MPLRLSSIVKSKKTKKRKSTNYVYYLAQLNVLCTLHNNTVSGDQVHLRAHCLEIQIYYVCLFFFLFFLVLFFLYACLRCSFVLSLLRSFLQNLPFALFDFSPLCYLLSSSSIIILYSSGT